jgi:hypothetical protein
LIRHRFIAALALAAACTVALPCGAQSSLPKDLIETKSALTGAQKAQLGEYADRLGKAFAEGTPAEVVAARNELIDVCRNVNTSEVFRRDLAVAMIRRFEPITKSQDTFRPTNAFIAAQFLRTPEAVDFLVDNVDPSTQPDALLRASAASQLPKSIAQAGLIPAQAELLAKRIAKAAQEETNWMAIAGEIAGIGELLALRLPPAQADSVTAAQASIVNSLTERVQAGQSPELVRALQRGLLAVRDQLTAQQQTSGRRLLDGISPSLVSIDRMKREPPSQLRQDPGLDAAFRSVVNTADLLQKLNTPR